MFSQMFYFYISFAVFVIYSFVPAGWFIWPFEELVKALKGYLKYAQRFLTNKKSGTLTKTDRKTT